MSNLAQNLISVVLFLKVTKGSQKMATTKINHKNALCVSKLRGENPNFLFFFFFFYSYEKDLQ